MTFTPTRLATPVLSLCPQINRLWCMLSHATEQRQIYIHGQAFKLLLVQQNKASRDEVTLRQCTEDRHKPCKHCFTEEQLYKTQHQTITVLMTLSANIFWKHILIDILPSHRYTITLLSQCQWRKLESEVKSKAFQFQTVLQGSINVQILLMLIYSLIIMIIIVIIIIIMQVGKINY